MATRELKRDLHAQDSKYIEMARVPEAIDPGYAPMRLPGAAAEVSGEKHQPKVTSSLAPASIVQKLSAALLDEYMDNQQLIRIGAALVIVCILLKLCTQKT